MTVKGQVGTASLEFNGLASFAPGTVITLGDHFTGQSYDLVQNPVVNFSITADPASQGGSRFVLLFSPAVTGLNANKPTAQLSVWPNPAQDQVNISVKGFAASTAKVDIMDQLGRVVSQQVLQITDLGTGKVVVNQLPAGMYQVRVQNDTQTATQQLVVR
jgi:hypothetical protein